MVWPIILANCATPLLGLADTAVIGHVGSTSQLAAIALGSLVFNFLFWGFGFLRMGTSGFVAQAMGAGDDEAIRATLIRALILGLSFGSLLLALQGPIGNLAFDLFSASPDAEHAALDYFFIRIWGAPAALCNFALLGLFIGLGQSARVLQIQIFMNATNILLDVWLAGHLGWGLTGIAYGTAIAEWSTCALALCLAWQELRARHNPHTPFWPSERLLSTREFFRTLQVNSDLMIRTLFMLGAFAWFTNQSALFGNNQLAANHVLLQLISFSAFFLDGFAFGAESLVGRAMGAKRLDAFDLAIRRSSTLAAGTALLLSVSLLILGEFFISALTDKTAVQDLALENLHYAAIYVLISVLAFQLDGVFIGSSHSRALRNSSILSVMGFYLACVLFQAQVSNQGLWLAFIAYVGLRGLTLLIATPKLRRQLVRPIATPAYNNPP